MADMAEIISTSASFGGMVFRERAPETVKPEFFDPDQVAKESMLTFELLGAEPEQDPTGELSPLEIRTKEMKSLHDSLVADNPTGEIEVVAFRPVNTDSQALTVRSLFQRFNQGDEAATADRAFWPLLDQYETGAFNSRTAMGVPAFDLGHQALALMLGGDTHGDNTLHYPGKTGKQQAVLLGEAQKATLEDEARQTRELTTSIPDDIVLAARALVRGAALPHQSTWSRKAHMKTNKVGGIACFPYVRSRGSALRLDGVVGRGRGFVGVSRSVGQKQVPQA